MGLTPSLSCYMHLLSALLQARRLDWGMLTGKELAKSIAIFNRLSVYKATLHMPGQYLYRVYPDGLDCSKMCTPNPVPSVVVFPYTGSAN